MASDLTWFKPLPTQHEFICDDEPEVVYAGGVGCIAGDTLIWNPVSGDHERVDEMRGPGFVAALNNDGRPCIATRTAPVCKGEDALYEFETAHGTIVATGAHRFLTTEGWKRGDELSVGAQLLASVLAPRESTLDTFPSTRREGDPRCSHTARDFGCGCPACLDSGDAQLLQEAARALSAAPSRGDAPGCSQDGQGEARARSRSCRSSVPSDKTGSPLADDLRLPGRAAQARHASSSVEHAPQSSQVALLPRRSIDPPRTESLLALRRAVPPSDAPALRDAYGEAAGIPQLSLSVPHPSPLLRKTRIGAGRYWDLHVPGYENYWAAGMWHHNSGKTISGGFKTLRAVLKWPGTNILVGRQSYRALEDTTKRVLMDGDDKPPIIPPEMVAHFSNKENRYVLHNGSEILFRSLEDHNIEKLLSLNLGGFYVDECTETTERVWLALMSRLRHPFGPRNGWGTTNPNGHDWVWRNFHPDGPNSSVEGRIAHLYLQPTEGNPHLPDDYMAMLRTRPKEWQKRFVDCSFDTAAGSIWDMWDRRVHVVPANVPGTLPVTWYRGRAMDHGRRNPTAVLWGMVDSDGFILIADEHYQEGLLPSQHAPIIRAKDEMLAPGINLGPIIAPPDCFRRDHGGHSVADEYRAAAGLSLTLADDNVDAGLLRVAEWMQRDPHLQFPEWHEWHGTYGPDSLSPLEQEQFGRDVGRGSPRLFVAERCTNLITEIPDYRWADLSPSQEEKTDAPEQPRKLRDHACDCLRYWLMSRPRPFASPQRIDPGRIVRQPSLTHGLLERQF